MNRTEVKLYKLNDGNVQTSYQDPKTGKRKRKRFQSLKEAKIFKAHVESKVNSRGPIEKSDYRLAQAMKDYMDLGGDRMLLRRKIHFKAFVDKFGIYRVDEISTSDLQKWMDDLKAKENYSTKTMNHMKSQFTGFFKYLELEGYISSNPILGVKYKRYDAPRRARIVLSVDEVEYVLESARKFDEVFYRYISCLVHTGARKSEILKLDRSDIDFNTGLVHFRETKNYHERFVRISLRLEKVFREQLLSHEEDPLFINDHGKRIASTSIQKRLVKFRAFFPIPNKIWTFHSLRHSFAYNFLKQGGQMYQLQAILGHKSIDVTVDIYGQLQAQDIDDPSPYKLKETNHELF